MPLTRFRTFRGPRHAPAAWLAVVLGASSLSSWSTVARAEEGAAQGASPASSTQAAPAAESNAKANTAVGAPAPTFEREEAAVADAKRREVVAERSGQTELARRLSALSARWQAVIEALRAAAQLEAEAGAIEDERIEVQEQTDRLVTLVEQTEARRARALARLQALGLEPAGLPVAAPTAAPPAPSPAPAAPAPPAPAGTKPARGTP